MPRNFGLSHFSRRASCAPTGSGANAGVSFFTWKAAAKRVYDRLCKRDRASAQQVAIRVIYMGRVLFHSVNNCPETSGKSDQVEGIFG